MKIELMENQRHNWVDLAKAIGIFLVFYGHLVEKVYKFGVPLAFYQFKFIYSFHMPLFFFISGFFWKYSNRKKSQIKLLFNRRIIPVLFFGSILLPLWLIAWKVTSGSINWDDIISRVIDYFYGYPRLNWVCWFLVCLFTTEIFAMICFPNLKSRINIFIFGLFSLLFGLIICKNIDLVVNSTYIKKNMWFIHESFVSLGFYSLGYALFPIFLKFNKNKIWIFLLSLSFFSLLSTYNKNFHISNKVVMMMSSVHGEIFPFLISGVSGIVFIITVAKLFPNLSLVRYLGTNSIVFLGLSGAFLHFINPFIVKLWLPNNDYYSITIFCLFFTIASILSCIPISFFMINICPYLVGKSSSKVKI